MSKGSQIMWGVFKWVVIPSVLMVVGYTFIGPRIGRPAPSALQNLQEQIAPSEQPQATAPTAPAVAEADGRREWPTPTVEVAVTRLNGRRVQDRESGAGQEGAPSESEITEDVPPVDEAPVEGDTPVDSGAPADDEAMPTEEPPPAVEPEPEPLPDGPA